MRRPPSILCSHGDFKMNKAVIYFGATGNEAADQMVMQVLEGYCTVNGYEVVAVISENARPDEEIQNHLRRSPLEIREKQGTGDVYKRQG